MVKMLLDDREKPIGVQILGPRAGDLLSEWVSVMNGNVKLSTLAGQRASISNARRDKQEGRWVFLFGEDLFG